jgi:DNA-binding Lrp family transcriptional regulator
MAKSESYSTEKRCAIWTRRSRILSIKKKNRARREKTGSESIKERRMREAILKVLEKNSRIDLKELAVILDVEEAVIANEMAAMEAEGVICGYHTLINWEKTSDEKVSALIEVRVTPQRGQGFDSIAERIYQYPEVRSVYLMSGGYDLMIILEGKTLREVSSFVSDKLATLETVLSTATHFILRKYKDHGTIFAQKREDEREIFTP